MYQLVSVLRQRVFFSPVPTLAAAQAPIKSKLSNNLKKDLDNIPPSLPEKFNYFEVFVY